MMSDPQTAEGAGFTQAPPSEKLDWQRQGLCHTSDEDFYPEGPQLEAKSRPAQRVCQSCPVLSSCRTWALERHELFGIWGGLSEIDREAIWTGHRRHRRHVA